MAKELQPLWKVIGFSSIFRYKQNLLFCRLVSHTAAAGSGHDKNLGFGSKLIRLLLTTGFLLSIVSLFIPGINAVGLKALAGVNALLFLAVLIMFATRKLASRVRRLAAVMDKAAEGELAVRGTDLAQDEVGMLNRNFNAMLEQLEGIVLSIRRQQPSCAPSVRRWAMLPARELPVQRISFMPLPA